MTTTPSIGQYLPPENRVELMQRILSPHAPSLRTRIERTKWRDLVPKWLKNFLMLEGSFDPRGPAL